MFRIMFWAAVGAFASAIIRENTRGHALVDVDDEDGNDEHEEDLQPKPRRASRKSRRKRRR